MKSAFHLRIALTTCDAQHALVVVKRPIKIGVFVVLSMLLFCGLVILLSPKAEWRSQGRLLVDQKSVANYSPYWLQDRFAEISNVLSSSRTISRLAAMSQVNESDFKLIGPRPIRSTRFIGIEYAGASSNGVQRVASNACVVVVEFYRTNNPSWEATNYDAYVMPPSESTLERGLDWLQWHLK